MSIKLHGEKSLVTIVVEMDCSSDCEWIWNSHRDVILGNDKTHNGVKVINMREGDCLKSLRKLEEAESERVAAELICPDNDQRVSDEE